ncbi:DUF6298 domain-containing protein [Salisaeta longa]|uniref:DUF6298 domain-containing protein n=1 Tax=Salisaeta longa TaxID=503170 RepID=UPI000423F3BA|nr:DUF6298 domain-containing protein [Salisaeta longa]
MQALLAWAVLAGASSGTGAWGQGVQPAAENPRFWSYEGAPVMLLGGTRDDNLFQMPGLEAHLDSLVNAGGNYIRLTMSSRRIRGYEVYPFYQRPDGRYDLTRWNPEYWTRLERLLRLTHARDIIVQVELWDQWDQSRTHWADSPWNPDNNVNYDTTHTTLRGDGHYTTVAHDNGVTHDFYQTIPGAHHDTTVLRYQRRFVDRVLDATLRYNHVLYVVTNELLTQHPVAWSRYWMAHVRRRAAQAGRRVHVTEMFQAHDVRKGPHRIAHADTAAFDFIELSQNASQRTELHWTRLQWVYRRLQDAPRPINHVKIYGGAVRWTGGAAEGIDRFWRSLIGGAASVRFHRPPYGIGLNAAARAHLSSARALATAFAFPQAVPDARHTLLADRSPNEAYLTRIPGAQYVVYFPDGGAVRLDLRSQKGLVTVRWLNAPSSQWSPAITTPGGRWLPLRVTAAGDWIALITRTDQRPAK